MVIECTECHTRFKLADDKVKPGGTKVRCSKCRHIFTVMPPAPEPPPEEEIDFGEFNMERLPETSGEVAGPAAAEASAGGEEEARQPTEFTFGAGAENQAGEPASSQEPPDDFAFGEEPAAADADQFSMDAASTASLESSAGDLGPSDVFAFAGEGAESDTFTFGEAGETEAADDNFNLEESEEFPFPEDQAADSLADTFVFDTEATTESVEFDFGEEEAAAEDDTDFSWESDSADSGEEGFDFEQNASPSAAADEFDFSGMTFGEEDSVQSLPVADPERLPQSQPKPALLSVGEEQLPRKAAQVETTAASTEPRPLSMAKTSRRKSPVQGVMLFIGILVMALLGGAIYFYWQGGIPELTAWVDRLTGQTVSSQAAGQIRLEELNSFYVKNGDVGQLLVIQGRAVNDFTDARSSLAVKGVLFSKEGKMLLQQTVYCGNPLTQEALQKLSYAKIEESMNNPFGESLSNLNVAPGKALPFTIVFRNLPTNIAEFTVEVVDSKPASKQ